MVNVSITTNIVTAERGGIQIGFFTSGTPTYAGKPDGHLLSCMQMGYSLRRRSDCCHFVPAQQSCGLAGAYPNHGSLTISNNILNGSSFTPLMVRPC